MGITQGHCHKIGQGTDPTLAVAQCVQQARHLMDATLQLAAFVRVDVKELHVFIGRPDLRMTCSFAVDRKSKTLRAEKLLERLEVHVYHQQWGQYEEQAVRSRPSVRHPTGSCDRSQLKSLQ